MSQGQVIPATAWVATMMVSDFREAQCLYSSYLEEWRRNPTYLTTMDAMYALGVFSVKVETALAWPEMRHTREFRKVVEEAQAEARKSWSEIINKSGVITWPEK